MVDFIFLNTDDVLMIHEVHIGMFGGLAGVRDLNLLKSAVLAPQASFNGSYLHADVFAMAGAYMHGIKNHPFFDGNKRTGISCGLVFLKVNDMSCNFSNNDLVELGISIANSTRSLENISERLRNNYLSEKLYKN